MVGGESQLVAHPTRFPPRSGPSCRHISTFCTSLQTAGPWRSLPAGFTALTGEALEVSLELFGHKFLDPGTQKGRAEQVGKALDGPVLCRVDLSCGKDVVREEWGAPGGAFLPGPEGDTVYAHEPNETKRS